LDYLVHILYYSMVVVITRLNTHSMAPILLDNNGFLLY